MQYKDYKTLMEAVGKEMDSIGISPHNACNYVNELLSHFCDAIVSPVDVVEDGMDLTEFEMTEG